MHMRRRCLSGETLLVLLLCGCSSKRAVGYAVPPPDGTAVVCPVSGDTCVKSPEMKAAVFDMQVHP